MPSCHVTLTCPRGAAARANRCHVLLDLEVLKRNLEFRFLSYSPCSSVFQFIEMKLWGINKIPWGPRLSHGPPFGRRLDSVLQVSAVPSLWVLSLGPWPSFSHHTPLSVPREGGLVPCSLVPCQMHHILLNLRLDT